MGKSSEIQAMLMEEILQKILGEASPPIEVKEETLKKTGSAQGFSPATFRSNIGIFPTLED